MLTKKAVNLLLDILPQMDTEQKVRFLKEIEFGQEDEKITEACCFGTLNEIHVRDLAEKILNS